MLQFTPFTLPSGLEMDSAFAQEAFKKQISIRLPKKYHEGNVIKTETRDIPYKPEVNLNAYKKMAAGEYHIVNKQTKERIPMNAGVQTTVEILDAIPRYDDTLLYGNLIMATCINDYMLQCLAPGESRQYFEDIKYFAMQDLSMNRYDVWHSASKNYLPVCSYNQPLNEDILSDIGRVAQYMVDAFDSMFADYDIIYVRPRDFVFDAAENEVNKTIKELQHNLLEQINLYR